MKTLQSDHQLIIVLKSAPSTMPSDFELRFSRLISQRMFHSIWLKGVPHRRALRNFKKTNRQIQRLSYKGVTIPCKLVPLPSVCSSIPQLLYVSPKRYSVIIECRNFTPYWTFFSWLILDHPRITPFQILIVTFGNFWLLTETCNILIIANSRFFEECILSFSLAHP